MIGTQDLTLGLQRLGFLENGPKRGFKALARVKIGLFAEARVRGKTGAVASPVSEPAATAWLRLKLGADALPQMRPSPRVNLY